MESFIFILRTDDERLSKDSIPYKWYLKDEEASKEAISQNNANYGYGCAWIIDFDGNGKDAYTRFGHRYDAGIYCKEDAIEWFDITNYEIWHIQPSFSLELQSNNGFDIT